MITRVSALTGGHAANHRQELGLVIKFHREERKRSVREVSRRCKVSVSDVEAWERGGLVPTSDEWRGLCQGVNRALNAYGELYQEARKEQDAERTTITKGIQMHGANGATNHSKGAPVATNLGEKLRDVKLTTPAQTSDVRTVNPGQPVSYVPPKPVEIPIPAIRLRQPEQTAPHSSAMGERKAADGRALQAADGRALQAARPPGSMSLAGVQQRQDWARLMFRSRPRMPINGPDGLLAMMRQRFGIGIDTVVAQQIKAEVHAELAILPPSVPPGITPAAVATTVAAIDPVVAYLMPETRAPAGTSTVEPNDRDIESAVQLILGAIDGLQTFTINVDEHGEASVDYQIRKIRVETVGGSLKVKR